MHTKYTLNAQKTRQHKDKRANPLLNKQPIYKVNQRQNVIIYALAQFIKLYKKENLIACLAHLTSLNAFPFLSFHKVDIRHKGAALHAFSLLLPTKAPFHPSKFPLTVECKTQCTPKRENIRFHNMLTLLQNRKRWSLISSSSLHKKLLFEKFHPLPFNWSIVDSQNSIPRRFPSKNIHSHWRPKTSK